MSPGSSTERRITARELRYAWSDIVRELIAGQVFILYHDKAPLARLRPVRRASSPSEHTAHTPPLPAIELVRLFDHQDLSRMLGITESTWSVQFQQGQFSVKVLERLAFLSRQVSTLRTFMPSSQVLTWFRRSQSELKGLSIIDHLAVPWDTQDHQATLVQVLVERARFDATPMPEP
ncbi:hypothetical protein [Deinococcus sp. QL22]|uniref:hypothetical protein n=1 Tax=Deinococcus sp. QL22 TaxID=2939437 RepID=UPI002016E067|nr:hypothetical protein [Deinococcus sp. QL22]UQN08443.1 hypothetical protein M1R55_17130 [Deinococcus sp. QL22]